MNQYEYISYRDIVNNEAVRTYVQAGNDALGVLGFTEHGFAHAAKTAETAAYVLEGIGADEREIELARIAAYMHDCGNMVNRHDHALTGAVIAFRILDKLNMPPHEVAQITTAIGNHDEGTGTAVSRIAAALILADKSDVRRTRVRKENIDGIETDIHDRVNYAVRSSQLVYGNTPDTIELHIDIDTTVCPVIDYFVIFTTRMLMCKNAAAFLGLKFRLNINGTQLL